MVGALTVASAAMGTGDAVGRWSELVAPGRRGPVAVLASGVLLFAVDTYVVASLLPSAVADIGGDRFYAWVSTIFLLTAVVSSILVSRLLAVVPTRRAYLLALAAFGTGLVVDAVSPSIALLLVGRAVQGVGGGLLSGMAYALIRTTLPRPAWTRASAVISMMWGVGLLIGPALGGVFAELGAWRWAFAAMALATALVAGGVVRALPAVAAPVPVRRRFPLVSVLLVGGAAVVLSVSGLAQRVAIAAGGLAIALVLLGLFVAHERRTEAGVLPRATFRHGSPLRAVYLTAAVLVGASAVETFVPLFGQRLADLPPLLAGFLGTVLALGWVLGEVASAGSRRRGTPRLAVTLGPALVVGGLALTAVTQAAGASAVVVGLWAVGLFVAGAGIGVGWPHLAAAALDAGEDGSEGDKASAAISTLQTLAIALATSWAGVAIGLGEPDPVAAGRLLYAALAATSVIAVVTAVGARRGVLAVEVAGRST